VDSEEDLGRANSLLGSTWGVMLAVGAGIGGVFSEVFGRSAAFVADSTTFLVAAILVALIRRPMQAVRTDGSPRPPMRPLADMGEAVALARRDKVVLALVASKTSFAIGAGLVSQLPVLASQTFGSGDVGRGLLIAARGVGSGIGPIVAARLVGGQMSRILTVCGASSLVFSFAYFGAAASPHIAVAALFVAIAHFGGGAQWTMSSYGLQLVAPDHMRGRVLAGDFALVTLTLAVTGLAAGAVSEAVGARWTLIGFSMVAAAAGTVYLRATAALRRNLRNAEPHR
jgi:predicted MFS family arabinose efflux permease